MSFFSSCSWQEKYHISSLIMRVCSATEVNTAGVVKKWENNVCVRYINIEGSLWRDRRRITLQCCWVMLVMQTVSHVLR